ncbi:MAG: hypothetical protein GQ534_10000 [Candidatus Delongbacteria bacterium]|nr:hypothetical protein [Candidatus Delongbacteria bacterium]
MTSDAQNGVTPTERYLNKLARNSFLSLWCYPNVFTNEGRFNGKGAAKELCDLLIVFGNDVLIFSDKEVKFNLDKEIDIAWKRWYKKAIDKSAGQLFKAEKWIVNHPDRIYLDNLNTIKFPLDIPNKEDIRVHKICVANGSYDTSRQYFKGENEGSLMINSQITGFNEHSMPFMIGHPSKERGFIHVFDELSLDRVFGEIDTITDFVKYLEKREKYLSQELSVISTEGEEQLLSNYLTNLNEAGEHDFVLPIKDIEKYNMVWIDDSATWNDFVNSPQYLAKKEANRISYIWDDFIEYFTKYSQAYNEIDKSSGKISDLEQALRFMAAEDRLRRRQLSESFYEVMDKTAINQKRARVVYSNVFTEKVYVFLILPYLEAESYDKYRKFRRDYLLAYCKVAKIKQSTAKYVIGIAQQPKDQKNVTEDILILDVNEWTKEKQDDAESLQQDLSILLDENLTRFNGVTREYPKVDNPSKVIYKSKQLNDKKKKNKRKIKKKSKMKNRK